MPPTMTSLPAVVDLREDASGDLILSWTEAPGARKKTISPAELTHLRKLADALSLAESREYGPAIVDARTALSSALFELLDGPERALTQRIARAEAENRRLDLVVRATNRDRSLLGRHPASWMRWEILPFAETSLRSAPPFTVVLQLGPQDLAAPRVLKGGGLRLLFMAFSPQDARPELDFEREEEELLKALAPLAERRRAHVRVVEEGTLEDIKAALLVGRFDVVHLSGHGKLTPDGPRLLMEDAFGSTQLVSPADLLEVLQASKAMPELVMLSSCHTAEVQGSIASFAAELVAAGVPNVIGWTRPVRDDLATTAGAALHEQLAAGKTPVEAVQIARDRMRKDEERGAQSTHAWGTLAHFSSSAAGFVIDDRAEPLSGRFDRDEVYKYLGGRMRVLQTGFVGRRRLVQRLLRVLVHGRDVSLKGAVDVAGACVFGMKGVGKSCAVGRTIERAKQRAPEMLVVVLHGVTDGRSVLEAFQEAIEASGGDEVAERLLARTNEPISQRVRRVMQQWQGRPAAIVLDDFEQNIERSAGGEWLLSSDASALLEALLPTCKRGKPKLLITSTAEFRLPSDHEGSIGAIPLSSFDAVEVQKLWMRGQASKELSSVSLKSWKDLASRLGGNARVLTWARALCAGKTDAELAEIAEHAGKELPEWMPGDEASEEMRAELSRLFLVHMAYEQARAAFGEAALLFVKRARVFEAAVPKEAFRALAEGLDIDIDRDLDALANSGLLEVGELDGARAYRVSPLVEPTFEAADAARWHEVASEVWERLSEDAFRKAPSVAVVHERLQAAWEHALRAKQIERAEHLASELEAGLHIMGLYTDELRLAEHHMEALPESPFGYRWAGMGRIKAGRPGPEATALIQTAEYGTENHPNIAMLLYELCGVLLAQRDLLGARNAIERALDLQVKGHGTEEHPDVGRSYHEFGRVLYEQGDLTGAREALERSLLIDTKVYGTEENQFFATTLHVLSRVLWAQGDFSGAYKNLKRAFTILIEVHGTDLHPDVAASLHEIAEHLAAEGDLEQAAAYYRRALDIEATCFGTRDHFMSAKTEAELAATLFRLGQDAEASELLKHAQGVLAEQVPDHPLLQNIHVIAAQLQNRNFTTRIHQDHPCPCGSNKPFHDCHGAPEVESI
jgi:tetratricopeptide (TPR) repeat protein